MLPNNIKLYSLDDIGFNREIEETGKTIEENAELKARTVFNYLNNYSATINIDGVFADDSGLEVEALNGAPGVFSARYSGEIKNDNANNQKLLSELKTVTKRHAQFKTVIALVTNNTTNLFEGVIKGTIAYEPRGKNGFGYDPLFIPQGYRSTFAELEAEEKNKISHRAIAVKKLVEHLKTNYAK